MSYYYAVFGLTIQSEIPLVAFRAAEKTINAPILVKTGIVRRPESDAVNVVNSEFLVYHPTFCYKTMPKDEGAFLIQKKQSSIEVILDFKNLAKKQTLLTYFYGTGLAAILQMQGKFAIHAYGVVTEDGLYLFCGPSGVGKSTLSAALKSRGYPFFTDDKCVLFQDSNYKGWMAYPSLQIMRLWEDTTAVIATNSFLSDPIRVVADVAKYQYQISPNEQVSDCVPLKTIFILSESQEVTTPTLQLLQGVEKMNYLQTQIFRRFMVQGFQQDIALWNFTSRLAVDIPVYLLRRPATGTVVETVDFVETIISSPTKN